MLTTLRQRDFALLWWGQLISVSGDWILYAALPFYVFTQTGSTLATGTIFISALLPSIVFSSVAGVWVDRWDQRRLLALGNMVQAALLLPMLAVWWLDWLWVIYLVSALQAIVSAFLGPARDALTPQVVEQSQLLAANSLWSLSDSLTRLTAPALGGFLVAWQGLPVVILLDFISFLLAGMLIYLVRSPSMRLGERSPRQNATAMGGVWKAARQEWLDGVRLVRHDPSTLLIFSVMGMVTFAGGIINALLAPFILTALQGNAVHFGWMLSAQGTGGLVGSVLVTRTGFAVTPIRLIAASTGASGGVLLAMFNITVLPLFLVLTACRGALGVGTAVGARTLLQQELEERYRGRVFGTYRGALSLMQLGGTGMGGVLGDQLGIKTMLNIAAVIYLLAGIQAVLRISHKSE